MIQPHEQEIKERKYTIAERVIVFFIIVLVGSYTLGISCGRYLIP